MIKSILMTPAQVSEYWHLVKEPIKKALAHGVGETKLESWLARALLRQAQIWAVIENEDKILGVAVTQFLEYDTHKTLHFVLVGGDQWHRWFDQFYVLEQFAKENGCTAIEQWGRRGWTRILPNKIPGFKTAYYVMRKELTNEETKDN